jgi:hypothetical protein
MLKYYFVLLVTSTVVAAQCTNYACVNMNYHYYLCRLVEATFSDFKPCLCTQQFLVNYDRCLRGSVCAWDGDPEKLDGPCVAEYCPGIFEGSFDPAEFCTQGTPPPSSRQSFTLSFIQSLTYVNRVFPTRFISETS